MNKRDLTASVVLFAIADGAIWYASRMPFGKLSAPQAGFFPLLIAIILAVLSIILFKQAINTKGEKQASTQSGSAWGGRPLLLTIVSLFAFTIFFEHLGYLISTFLLMIFLLRVIGAVKWRWVVTVAFCTTGIFYLLFEVLLKIPFPSGLL